MLGTIYDFIGVESFQNGTASFHHDVDLIEKQTQEDDRVHTYTNLHTVEPKLHTAKIRHRLDQYKGKFQNANFWEQFFG